MCSCVHATAGVPAASRTSAESAGREDRTAAGAKQTSPQGTAGSGAAAVRFSTDTEGRDWASTQVAEPPPSPGVAAGVGTCKGGGSSWGEVGRLADTATVGGVEASAVGAQRTCVTEVEAKAAASCGVMWVDATLRGAAGAEAPVRASVCASAPVPAATCTSATAGVAGWEETTGAGAGAELASSHGVAGAGAPAWVAAFLCARPLREAAGTAGVAGVAAAATWLISKAEGACSGAHTSAAEPAAPCTGAPAEVVGGKNTTRAEAGVGAVAAVAASSIAVVVAELASMP